MSFVLKLALAIGFGLLAAVFNYFALNSQATPTIYETVVVNADLKPGRKLTAELFTRAQVPGKFVNVRHVLVAWEDRAMLLERVLSRELQTGDPVLWRDVEPLEGKFQLAPAEVALQIPFRDVAFDSRDLTVGQPFGVMLGKGEGESAKDADLPEVLGPFRLLRRPDARDGIVTVAAARSPAGAWEPQMEQLLKGLRRGARIAAVVYYRAGAEPGAGGPVK